MGIKLSNNANATLAAGINSSATSITLTSGQGARFPSLSGGDYFYATLVDTSNNLEIVKCTARSTDVLTVVRAQESTTARAYSTGDRIEIRLTAQTFIDAVNEIGPTQVSDEANTSTGYFALPSGTTAQRPGSPATGVIRHNTETNVLETYDGTLWRAVGDQSSPYSVQYLVVAGGAAGGAGFGGGAGGGGAGGYRSSVTGESSGGGSSAESPITVQPLTAYTVTIGAGGAPVNGNVLGTNGGNSVFGSITSLGGGGASSQIAGASGGCGGGGGELSGVTAGGAGTSGQGYAGGTGNFSGGNAGAGGGGAGAVGGNSSSGAVGAGGIGVQSSITGTATYRAGGGGASGNGLPGSSGGLGGGGNGGPGSGGSGTVTSGAANTGGGGGGTYLAGAGTAGGGSGIVIIRYSGPQRATGGTVTSSGGFTIHTFTSSGTFTA
jgi:hypothetical protein